MNAEVLLMFVLGVNRAYLYAHPERELTSEEETRYDEVLAQRSTGMPSQYITGHQEFWGLDFVVSPAVLIPRPETEHLVETVLELARGIAHPKLVDVGTGSGCIALALAHELKGCRGLGGRCVRTRRWRLRAPTPRGCSLMGECISRAAVFSIRYRMSKPTSPRHLPA